MSKLIEPEDVVPTSAGVMIGFAILAFFFVLVSSMGLQTFVEFDAIPRQ